MRQIFRAPKSQRPDFRHSLFSQLQVILSATKFTLKTKVELSFVDTNGNKTWRLKRFALYKNTTDFVETQNHFVQFSNNQYIYTENNVAYLKAIFPLKNNTRKKIKVA